MKEKQQWKKLVDKDRDDVGIFKKKALFTRTLQLKK